MTQDAVGSAVASEETRRGDRGETPSVRALQTPGGCEWTTRATRSRRTSLWTTGVQRLASSAKFDRSACRGRPAGRLQTSTRHPATASN